MDYIRTLGDVAEIEIVNFDSLLEALKSRVNYFHQNGCRISDHGLEFTHASDFTHAKAKTVFEKLLSGSLPTVEEASLFNSCVLYELFVMYHDHGWTQQLQLYHQGGELNLARSACGQASPYTCFSNSTD